MTFNWKTVPLENFIAIETLRKQPATDHISQGVSIISLLTGKPESYYEEMKLDKLQAEILAMHVFLKTPIEEKLVKNFTIKGRKFCIGTGFDEWSESQRRQLAIFTGATLGDYSMLRITEENYWEKSSELVAILCDERTRLRKKLNFDERVKLIREHLPTSIGMGLTLFFWGVSNETLPILASHLQSMASQLQEK